jgi:branched-chain amino acid transport system substrate-binding protein
LPSQAVRRAFIAICATAALATTVAACGSDDDDGGSGGDEVTVYSSFPLQGASRPIGEALQNGIELAFKENDFKAGDVTVNFEPLDDSTAQAGAWTPEAESANARKAIADDSAVGYLGTFNSGAAAISIPLLNEADMAMLSPGNTAVGLTTDEAGAEEGEPDEYYPTGVRNYARIVPKDTVQGAALAQIMEADGCTTVGILNDQEVYGEGLAENVEVAGEGRFEVASNEAIDPKAANYRSVASELADQGVDCFLFSGITANGAVQLYKDVAAALPDAQLYGPDGVAEATFYDPEEGGLPADVAERVTITVATLDPAEYGPEGEQFFEDYAAEFGGGEPNPYSIYGYEAGLLMLDILERAEDPTDRTSVREAMFETQDRDSILGTYSIDENGDTTLTDYGSYRIEDGELVFDETVTAETE